MMVVLGRIFDTDVTFSLCIGSLMLLSANVNFFSKDSLEKAKDTHGVAGKD